MRERLLAPARRRRVGSALLALAAVSLALGVVVGAEIPDSSRGASSSNASGSGTATVARRDLIATDTQAGTLGYAASQPVFNRISGTLTSLPSVGTTIRPGHTLFTVDGAPVVLFDGRLPAYRTIASGIPDGPDVGELKRNLVALGFDPGHAITVNETFDSATIDAIDRWQASLGQTQTGQVTLGRVVFLPGPRRISAVEGVLGSTGGGAGTSSSASGSGSAAGASARVAPTTSTPVSAAGAPTPRAEFVALTSTSTASTPRLSGDASAAACPAGTAPLRRSETRATPPPTCPPDSPRPGRRKIPPTATQLLAQLVAAFKKLAASSGSGPGSSPGATTRGGAGGGTGASAGSGASRASGGASAGGSGASAGGSGGASSSAAGGAAPASQVLQTTSADLVVTVQLDATKQREAVLGQPVSVQLPDGSTEGGKITGVSSVAQSTTSSSSGAAGAGGGAASGTPSATVPVTITLSGHRRLAGLDQAAVSVNFQQQVQRGVLAVPVTALLATAGGGYVVEALQAGRRQLVPVTAGLFAGGYVQVSGSGLVEGMTVSDSQG